MSPKPSNWIPISNLEQLIPGNSEAVLPVPSFRELQVAQGGTLDIDGEIVARPGAKWNPGHAHFPTVQVPVNAYRGIGEVILGKVKAGSEADFPTGSQVEITVEVHRQGRIPGSTGIGEAQVCRQIQLPRNREIDVGIAEIANVIPFVIGEISWFFTRRIGGDRLADPALRFKAGIDRQVDRIQTSNLALGIPTVGIDAQSGRCVHRIGIDIAIQLNAKTVVQDIRTRIEIDQTEIQRVRGKVIGATQAQLVQEVHPFPGIGRGNARRIVRIFLRLVLQLEDIVHVKGDRLRLSGRRPAKNPVLKARIALDRPQRIGLDLPEYIPTGA